MAPFDDSLVNIKILAKSMCTPVYRFTWYLHETTCEAAGSHWQSWEHLQGDWNSLHFKVVMDTFDGNGW